MAEVPCPFCQTVLEPGTIRAVDVGGLARAEWTPVDAGFWSTGKKVVGSINERDAGMCPACEAVVIAPVRKRDNRIPQV